jgi:hypothetical protein
VKIGDSFAIYSLDVQDPSRLKEASGDLSVLVTDAKSLHHQVTFPGGNKGFAQTSVNEQEYGEKLPLCGFFKSSMAEKIDEALALADENITATGSARLLLASAHQVTALWFCKAMEGADDCTGETQLLIVRAPARNTKLSFGQVISSTAFLNVLAESEPVSGFTPK